MSFQHPPTDRRLPPAPKKPPFWLYFGLGLLTGIVGIVTAYSVLKTEIVQDFLTPPTRPYAAYVASLEQSNLSTSVMGKAWLKAGQKALADSTLILPPHQEKGYVSPDQQPVISYRINPQRGQLLSIQMELESVLDSPQLFIELFELTENGLSPPELIAFADSGRYHLTYTVDADESYLLRIQPELLARFSYRLQIVLGASLVFPVSGKDSKAIKSFWGDSRDGGRRSHKGVDIFARKGTPILAATDGRINRVRNGGLGGKVVWQRDANQPQSLYYAHLDTQWVSRGQEVKAGDTLGLVGNTGNARYTPPHLHFGIYQRRRGAVDPFPFVHQPPQVPAAIVAPDSGILKWHRSKKKTKLFVSTSSTSNFIQEINPNSPIFVLAATANWYLVQLADGTKGYIDYSATTSLDTPLERQILTDDQALFDQVEAGVITEVLEAGSEVDILASTDSYSLIKTQNDQLRWISSEAIH